MATRYNINDFALGNPAYVGATVSFWTVSGGAKTTTLATLYAASTGSTTLTNPRALDSDGKFSVPVYAEVATIATVSGLTIADHDTGIIGLAEVAAIESAAAAVAAVAAIASGELPITAISCSGGAINGTTVGATTPAAGKFTTLQTSALLSATLGLNVTGAAFTSRGITDNATATALTLSGSGANSVTIANGASNPTIGTSGGDLNIASATGVMTNSGATNSLVQSVGASGYGGFLSQGSTQAYYFFKIGATETCRMASSAAGMSIYTGASVIEQLRIVDSAGPNCVTITGGTNPTIGTSGGGLAFSASTGAYQFNVASSSLLVKASSGYAGLGIDGFTGGQAYQLFFINGTETNRISSDSSNALSIYTGVSAAEQVRITHTASANRYITLTGSNGGNPTIGTSGGGLGLSSNTALTDGLFYGWGATPTAWIAGTSASNVIGLYTSSAEQVRIVSVPSATKRLGLYGGAAGNAGVNVSSGSLELGSPVVLVAQTVGTTVGAAGGASALPATPLGYLTTSINGTACKVPYYTA